MWCLRIAFVAVLVLLLVIFTFNAYACLLPLFSVPQAAMGGGCADAQDEPVRQFCDSFTTLGLQSGSDFLVSVDAQVVSPGDVIPLASLMGLWISMPTSIQGYPAQKPPQDALVRTTVLRI